MFISSFLPVFFEVKRILKYLFVSSLNRGSDTFDPREILSIAVDDESAKLALLVSSSRCCIFGIIFSYFLTADNGSFGFGSARSSSKCCSNLPYV